MNAPGFVVFVVLAGVGLVVMVLVATHFAIGFFVESGLGAQIDRLLASVEAAGRWLGRKLRRGYEIVAVRGGGKAG